MGTYCWECGKNNEHGLQIKSYWEGEECICTWKPKKCHCAFPGRGCGGIIATILDCHCLNTATSVAYRAEGREFDTGSPKLYLTGSLSVRFLNPAPLSKPWVFRVRIKDMQERKITVLCSLFVNEKECATGEIIAVKMKM